MLPPAWVQRRALEKQEEASRDRSRWPLRIAVALVVLGALGIGGWRWLGVRPAARAHNAANDVAPPAALKITPAPPKEEAARKDGTPAADPPADAALPSGPLILELRAVE